jgi:hypothetical protein
MSVLNNMLEDVGEGKNGEDGDLAHLRGFKYVLYISERSTSRLVDANSSRWACASLREEEPPRGINAMAEATYDQVSMIETPAWNERAPAVARQGKLLMRLCWHLASFTICEHVET